MAEKPFDAETYPKFTVEEMGLMNDRYDDQVDDYQIENEENPTPEELHELHGIIVADVESATPEEIALLVFFHEQGDKDVWFDNLHFVSGGNFYGNNPIIKGNGGEHAVVKDDDVEKAFEQYALQLIDDAVLPRIPEEYRNYFDTEKFIDDMETDGYGQMATYDGDDNEVYVGDQLWHIFRLN